MQPVPTARYRNMVACHANGKVEVDCSDVVMFSNTSTEELPESTPNGITRKSFNVSFRLCASIETGIGYEEDEGPQPENPGALATHAHHTKRKHTGQQRLAVPTLSHPANQYLTLEKGYERPVVQLARIAPYAFLEIGLSCPRDSTGNVSSRSRTVKYAEVGDLRQGATGESRSLTTNVRVDRPRFGVMVEGVQLSLDVSRGAPAMPHASLGVGRRRPNAFGRCDSELPEQVAAQASLAIHNAKTFSRAVEFTRTGGLSGMQTGCLPWR